MNERLQNPNFQILLFVVLFIITAIYFEYPATMILQPQSMHNWRQADCASFARIYYESGMHFFEPKVYNVLAGEGNAVGEFPILYYFVALLYKIFGPYEFIFRIVNTCILMMGLLSLFQLSKRLLNDLFFAYLIPFLIFASPLIMLFGNNYLCDISSLSFAFMGWNALLKYRANQQRKRFWFSIIFFTLAALLKLNSVISLVAISTLYFIEFNQWEMGNRSRFFNHKFDNFIGFLLSFTIIASWYKWAIFYNEKYQVTFLGTKIWPNWSAWDTTDETFLNTINGFFKNAPINYFLPTIVLLIVLLYFSNRNRNLADSFMFQSLMLVLIGTLMFIFTFFFGIKDNIYYTINLYIFPTLILLNACYIFKIKYPIAFKSNVFRMLTILFLLINVVYAKSLNKDFYHQGKEHHRINENFYHENFRPFIDQVGIKKNEKVISIPDHTPNASLYSIGRYGWSDYNYLKDTFSINNAIRKGAKYLIISNAMMLSSPLIENYTANYVGNFENIFIYKIDLNSKNLRNRFVKLKTKDNYYISWFDDNAADLQITDATTAKQFYMIDIGDGTIAFKINTGRFIASNKETYGKLFINTEWMGDWETFTKIEIEPNKYALKTREGKFLRLNKENNFIGTADNYSEEIILIE